MTTEEKIRALRKMGFIMGTRDKRLNRKFKGSLMVAERYDDKTQKPTEDGSNGPWCIVGDNLSALIDEAYSLWEDNLL